MQLPLCLQRCQSRPLSPSHRQGSCVVQCPTSIDCAVVDQASKLTLSSRAFHSSGFGEYAEKVTKLMGFESVLPMNTGAEAVEVRCALIAPLTPRRLP